MIPWLLALSTAQALDLDEARARAVDRALSVERATAERDAARGERTAAVERSLPSVEGFADVSTGAGQTAFGFERPIATQIGLGVRFAWNVVDPAAWATAVGARRNLRSREATLLWTRVEARREATQRFAEAEALDEVVDALQVLVDDQRRLADVVRERATAGLVPQLDVVRIEADLASVTARLAEATGEAAARCAELQSLVGDPITGACDLTDTTWEAPADAEGEHPALQAFQASLEAARADRQSSVWTLAPLVDVDGTVAQYIVPGTGEGLGWQVGAGVTVPILNGRGTVGQLKSAQARERDADAALEEQRRVLAVARVSAEAGLRAARAALTAQDDAVRATDAARQGAEEEYTAGRIDVTALVQARRQWADALVQQARARARVGVALAEVEAARGVW